MEGLVDRHGNGVADHPESCSHCGQQWEKCPGHDPAEVEQVSDDEPELELSPVRPALAPRKLDFGVGPSSPIVVDSPPRAAKKPMSRLVAMLEERPNLAEYFDSFPYDISNPERIKMCRAYAAYLVSLEPPKPKATRKRTKKE